MPHTVENIHGPTDAANDLLAQISSIAKAVYADQVIHSHVERLRVISKQKKVLKALELEEKGLQKMICEYMGKNETLLDLDGTIAVTYKADKGKMKLDEATLELMYPEVYKDCLTFKEGSMRFLLKS